MLHPLIGDAAGDDVDSSKCLPGQVRLEGCREAAGVGALDVEGAGIPLGLHINAPVPAVGKPALFARSGDDVERVRQGRRQGLAELLDGDLGPVDGRPGIQRNGELLGRLKGPVLDEFGVDATVAGVVDVLFRLSMGSFVGQECGSRDEPHA